ncbi:phosphatase PAP2 family protein [Lacinutrix neustonica]
MQAGQHFLSDVLLGYALGALAGYYIPNYTKEKRLPL